MPDFEQALKARLGHIELAPQVAEDVVVELAGYLEDAYKHHLAAGIISEEAEMRALREIPDGRKLARKIQLAKQGAGDMNRINNRILQFWLPALVTSLIGTGLLAFMVEALGMRPIVIPVTSGSSMTIYLPWLLTLPVLGFLAAAMSRREGGTVRVRIVAAIFLSLIYFALPWMILPIAIAVDHETPHIAAIGWFFLNWAILPCFALLVGALPAAFVSSRGRAASRSAA